MVYRPLWQKIPRAPMTRAVPDKQKASVKELVHLVVDNSTNNSSYNITFFFMLQLTDGLEEFSGIQGSCCGCWENTVKRSQSQIWDLKFARAWQLIKYFCGQCAHTCISSDYWERTGTSFKMACQGRGKNPGGGTWIIFGWVCAARDSKLAPRSKKNFP